MTMSRSSKRMRFTQSMATCGLARGFDREDVCVLVGEIAGFVSPEAGESIRHRRRLQPRPETVWMSTTRCTGTSDQPDLGTLASANWVAALVPAWCSEGGPWLPPTDGLVNGCTARCTATHTLAPVQPDGAEALSNCTEPPLPRGTCSLAAG